MQLEVSKQKDRQAIIYACLSLLSLKCLLYKLSV